MTTQTGTNGDGYGMRNLVGIVANRQTYKNLCYLLLAAPLGMAYYTFVTLGLVFGALLLIFGIGIVILLVTILGSRLLADFERWLANALLDLELRGEDDPTTASPRGLRARIAGYLEAPSTWRGLGFLMVKFPLGIVAVAFLIPLFTALSLVTAPLRYPYETELLTVNDEPITWTIETLPEAVLAAALAAVLGLVLLHVANGAAYVARQMATALLDEPTPESATDEPSRSARRPR